LQLALPRPHVDIASTPLDELERIEDQLCALLGAASRAIRMLAGADAGTAGLEATVGEFMRTVATVQAELRLQHKRLVERGVPVQMVAGYQSDVAGVERDLVVWTDAADLLAKALDSGLRISSPGQMEFPREVTIYIDEFITRLRRGQVTESKDIAIETVNLLRHVISSSRWDDVAQLAALVKAVGRRLLKALPRELLIVNVLCRLLRIVAEESEAVEFVEDEWTSRRPRDARGADTPGMGVGAGARTEQPAGVERMTVQGFKKNILNEVNVYISELDNIEDDIAKNALEYIHSNEIVLTCGRSRTVAKFLLKAAAKRRFHVIVTECAPTYEGHEQARALAGNANIDVVVIPDSAVFAIMSRVNKVILGTRAVMANGGLIAASGTHVIAAAAHHHSTQVVVCAGPYKHSPWFPFNDDRFNTLVSPDPVLPYRDGRLVNSVDVISPRYDYVPPELVDIFVDSMGGHLPSYLYRLLQENYGDAKDLAWNIYDPVA
ncbi:GCD complex subunit gcd7, partial [Coemansia sp. RSA 2618]